MVAQRDFKKSSCLVFSKNFIFWLHPNLQRTLPTDENLHRVTVTMLLQLKMAKNWHVTDSSVCGC
jgi:hypothetical protein